MRIYVCNLCGYQSDNITSMLLHFRDSHVEELAKSAPAYYHFFRGKWSAIRNLKEDGLVTVRTIRKLRGGRRVKRK